MFSAKSTFCYRASPRSVRSGSACRAVLCSLSRVVETLSASSSTACESALVLHAIDNNIIVRFAIMVLICKSGCKELG